MLTYSRLAALYAATGDRHVLNVYVDATALDSVARRSWRRMLAAGIVAARKALADAPHGERAEFERAADRVVTQAAELPDDLDGAPGWAAFVAPDEVLYAGPTHKAPRPSVAWRLGIAPAAYLRLIDADGDVIVAMVDTRSTDLYRWNGRELAHLERIRAHAHMARAAHMGDGPSPGFHAGTKGTTLTDAAHRALEVGAERMQHEVAVRLEELARPSGWIVLTGIHATVSDTMRHLGKAAVKRAIYVSGVEGAGSPADLAGAAADGRRRLVREREAARVVDLLDRAAGRGRAVTGLAATRSALLAGAVREVLVTPSFLERAPADAVAAEVLTHGARLTALSDDAAARLDAESDGIAAVLRFPSRSASGVAGLSMAAG